MVAEFHFRADVGSIVVNTQLKMSLGHLHDVFVTCHCQHEVINNDIMLVLHDMFLRRLGDMSLRRLR